MKIFSSFFCVMMISHLYGQTLIQNVQVNTETQKGKPKIVLLDCFFNNEWKNDSFGEKVRYHYTWDDKSNSGFSLLGDLFRKNNFETKMLESAPSKKKLRSASVYIIVDPDTEKESDHPHYMKNHYAKAISRWVQSGGVLLLMGNDSMNSELKKFNILASRFGIRFNEDNFNRVPGNQFEQGAIEIPAEHKIFNTAKKIFIKELATLQVNAPASTVLSKGGRAIMAVAVYGKGSVFVVGDPWLYNEYVDGKRLSADYENYTAGEELVHWINEHSSIK